MPNDSSSRPAARQSAPDISGSFPVYKSIDDFAFAGYDYAFKGAPIPTISEDMELLAFNAGISNANVTRGLKVKPLTGFTKSVHTAKGRSDKELAICGNW